MEHDRHEIIVQESTPSYGKITIEPLEIGYGVTLGNSLRRVLLSSISGAAIVAVRIEGVLHEFSTVPGVKEDVIELLVNLKHIPVRCHSSAVTTLRLEAKGPKTVTAADIEPDSEVEFPDPEAYICTLEEGASIVMDLYVGTGTGCLPLTVQSLLSACGCTSDRCALFACEESQVQYTGQAHGPEDRL